MEITVLIENLGLRHLICEHGLSLHINCKGRSILLDMGSSGALAQNARELTAIGVGRLYTGHCTGMPAFELLRRRLGDRLAYMQTGDRIQL